VDRGERLLRKVTAGEIEEAVRRLAGEAAVDLPPDVEEALRRALREEAHELGRYALEQIVENAETARRERIPLCQDTGYFTVFLECGPGVLLPPRLREAVDRGVAAATRQAYLRPSVVEDPHLHRVNTRDNTPVQLHLEQAAEGETVRLTVMPKGGGSENASMLRMMLPTASREEIVQTVVEHVRGKAPYACPPVVVGVGLGGSADTCVLAAKRSLLRELGEPCPDGAYADLERELLERINRTGIGAAGFGGAHTALAVHLQPLPTHIALLPLAVAVSCHALRRKTAEL